MMVDDWRGNVPVAWLLQRKEDTTTSSDTANGMDTTESSTVMMIQVWESNFDILFLTVCLRRNQNALDAFK